MRDRHDPGDGKDATAPWRRLNGDLTGENRRLPASLVALMKNPWSGLIADSVQRMSLEPEGPLRVAPFRTHTPCYFDRPAKTWTTGLAYLSVHEPVENPLDTEGVT